MFFSSVFTLLLETWSRTDFAFQTEERDLSAVFNRDISTRKFASWSMKMCSFVCNVIELARKTTRTDLE